MQTIVDCSSDKVGFIYTGFVSYNTFLLSHAIVDFFAV